MAIVSTLKGTFNLTDAAYNAAVKFCALAEDGERERIAREAVYRYFYANIDELAQLINQGLVPAPERQEMLNNVSA